MSNYKIWGKDGERAGGVLTKRPKVAFYTKFFQELGSANKFSGVLWVYSVSLGEKSTPPKSL